MSSSAAETKVCRISEERLVPLFSLGELHVSAFPKSQEQPQQEPIELKLCLAPQSGLVQLAHTTPPDDMYREYWYRSGTNATMTKELGQIAQSVQEVMKLAPGDTWIDIGCNDGTLLSFLDPKLTRIGFDPAKNSYVQESSKYANLIINNYFSAKAYKASKYGKKKAMAITSIAMFYDLDDPHTFVSDIANVLDDNGLWVIQMSYLPLMLEQLAFDNICHEHVTYYSLTSLKKLLDAHQFTIVDCQLNDVNGGSFRIYVRKSKADTTRFATAPYRDVAQFRVDSILTHEKALKLDKKSTYDTFYKNIAKLKKQTVDFIKKEKKKGKTIWGYGASTKGNTLLQWFGLDHTLIDGIAERSPAKFGRKTIGTNIPIYSEEDMRKAKPDYLLVLPWHFINEFRQRETDFLKRGGKFIVPCPKFEIISAPTSGR